MATPGIPQIGFMRALISATSSFAFATALLFARPPGPTRPEELIVSPASQDFYFRGFQVTRSPRMPAGYNYGAKLRIAPAGLSPASMAASLAAPPPTEPSVRELTHSVPHLTGSRKEFCHERGNETDGRGYRLRSSFIRSQFMRPQAAAACEPLPPCASDLVAEPLQTLAVPRPTVVCAVAPDRPSEVVVLRLDRQVPVTLAPVVYRFQRTGETAFRRDLANDVLALHRPAPRRG